MAVVPTDTARVPLAIAELSAHPRVRQMLGERN
jgi:hypothetical protein